MKVNYLRTIVLIAIFLALGVVTLGAYTRLTNAGLGCPDWPGCYGKIVLPTNAIDLAGAQQSFPAVPIEPKKAWTEMIHRYAAGTLGSLIFLIVGFGTLFYRHKLSLFALFSLIGLLIFQALLGMWTVTLKLLPVVVMGHLLGGILLFSFLSFLFWHLGNAKTTKNTTIKLLTTIAIFIVFIQIALGGWVSSNYAGIACLGFPTCNGQWLPHLDFAQGFHLLSPVGVNYQGGVLDSSLRVTIQFVHRIGAVITAIYIIFLSLYILLHEKDKRLCRLSYVLLLLILTQFSLGIVNVIFLLPLWAAVAHNGVAAILLATLFSIFYFSKGRPHDL
ncbi:cytochrome c oxidase assembly protein [Legionella adelaidensis]|uniref:Cytochrome c oxidase assembly protein n=1 Tax=Legionella adelaidensis TaxID=45056 RepID=A0A0W0R670_9GAMM|nr:COX15/CtaA family protein [Legionella adelaidensis]KTC66567.1 cytochrome c oxidase assembly protein [Legionella adelaidensis]